MTVKVALLETSKLLLLRLVFPSNIEVPEVVNNRSALFGSAIRETSCRQEG